MSDSSVPAVNRRGFLTAGAVGIGVVMGAKNPADVLRSASGEIHDSSNKRVPTVYMGYPELSENLSEEPYKAPRMTGGPRKLPDYLVLT